MDDIPQVIDSMTLTLGDGSNKANKYYSTLALALIFLGNGFPDECHDLITPLSWQDDTYFGGPSLTSTISGEDASASGSGSVVALASYAHALLHRREGFAQGEFGMMGFQNANYWANAAVANARTNTHAHTNPLPFQQVKSAVLDVAKEYGKDAMDWCRETIGDGDESVWEIRALHELCANVSRDYDNKALSESFKSFAERAAEIELRILLKCSLEHAGYDCGDCLWRDLESVPRLGSTRIDTTASETEQSTTSSSIYSQAPSSASQPKNAMNPIQMTISIDESAALSAANKISSAHLGVFESSGSVTLRNVCRSLSPEETNLTYSIAAGLACRLLSSPAVCIPSNEALQLGEGGDDDGDYDEMLQIILPSSELQSEHLAGTNQGASQGVFYGGGPLTVGDAFAAVVVLSRRRENSNESANSDNGVYTFLPCPASDERAIFVDRFHGTRGETPTSVLQWSKGTVHISDHLRQEQK